LTARIAGDSTGREGSMSSDARSQRVHANLQRKIPPGAQFDHISSRYGDQSECDGCQAPIEGDDVEFELAFFRGVEAMTVKLHLDCWESWRTELLHRSHDS
jgi:hypothetical protein